MELWCAEVDYHCVALARCAEIAKGLGDVTMQIGPIAPESIRKGLRL